MTAYLDTSVVVALLARDAHSERAEQLLRVSPVLLLSPLARIEFAAVVGRRLRRGEVTQAEAETALLSLDRWAAIRTERVEIDAADLLAAERLVRRFDLKLRTQDALHIATAQRLGATLATFDIGMANAARALGVDIAAA